MEGGGGAGMVGGRGGGGGGGATLAGVTGYSQTLHLLTRFAFPLQCLETQHVPKAFTVIATKSKCYAHFPPKQLHG